MILIGVAIQACSSGGSSSAPSDAIAEQLTAAQSYLSSSLPNLNNSVGLVSLDALHQEDKPGFVATNFITPSNWSSISVQISPPGGVVSGPEPTYGGSAMPSTVNYRDYFKMSLDPEFYRASGSSTFRPTVFGRLDNLIDVFRYMTEARMPSDVNGLPVPGTHELILTISGMGTINIHVDVEATASSALYDRKMYLVGYTDSNASGAYDSGVDSKIFDNMIWIKSTTSQLNMMMNELQDRAGSDGIMDVFTSTVLSWNLLTGAFAYEYATNPNDSNGSAFETYRVLIESTGGKSWVYGLQANNADEAASSNPYMQWALFTPSSGSTQDNFSWRHLAFLIDGSRLWQSSVRAWNQVSKSVQRPGVLLYTDLYCAYRSDAMPN
jgi:hypothetical protein